MFHTAAQSSPPHFSLLLQPSRKRLRRPFAEETALRNIYSEALAHGQLSKTSARSSPRVPAGSPARSRSSAPSSGRANAHALKLDRVYKQDVMVPHWERGAKETVALSHPRREGRSGRTRRRCARRLRAGDITAEVVEVKSLDELATRPRKTRRQIVFFNRRWIRP